MSGTAYGSIVLHVTPDAASGGPLAKVRNGDRIRLSVKERRIDLLVPPDELARRKTAPVAMPERGYARLYRREILQADRGCDFDFLRKHPLGDGGRSRRPPLVASQLTPSGQGMPKFREQFCTGR